MKSLVEVLSTATQEDLLRGMPAGERTKLYNVRHVGTKKFVKYLSVLTIISLQCQNIFTLIFKNLETSS